MILGIQCHRFAHAGLSLLPTILRVYKFFEAGLNSSAILTGTALAEAARMNLVLAGSQCKAVASKPALSLSIWDGDDTSKEFHAPTGTIDLRSSYILSPSVSLILGVSLILRLVVLSPPPMVVFRTQDCED